MSARSFSLWALLCSLLPGSVGCRPFGRPAHTSGVTRPDQVLDFATLYQQNCSGCHGANGQNGAALSLANPVYLAIAGESNLKRIVAEGVPGTLMPPFAESAGGMLTDSQIAALARGMIQNWSRPDLLVGQIPPPYASSSAGDPAEGEKAFAIFCARCHGDDGAGTAAPHLGSLVEPSYLALVSDQSLRDIIVAGRPREGMPDWRSDLVGAGARPIGDREITDIVAWLATHRSSTPGQQDTQVENSK